MAITKTYLGDNPDGSPHFHYESDGTAPVVITGPIKGKVTTADGTDYNVTDAVIEVKHGHQDEVAALIGSRFETEGHPDHDPATPFTVAREA